MHYSVHHEKTTEVAMHGVRSRMASSQRCDPEALRQVQVSLLERLHQEADSMRPCTKCGADFEPTPGQAKKKWWYCRACRSATWKREHDVYPTYRKTHLKERRAWVREFEKRPHEKEKRKSRIAAQQAFKSGKITKTLCQRCGGESCEMHHNDYSKPLEVIWVCKPCHAAIHKAA